MTDTQIPPTEPGAALLKAGRFLRPGTPAPDLHSVRITGGREADAFYRTDYPSVGPDRPEYEPRGCPRGAAAKAVAELRAGTLKYDGGPGMGGDGPFGPDSGRTLLPLVSVENFHALRKRQTSEDAKEA